MNPVLPATVGRLSDGKPNPVPKAIADGKPARRNSLWRRLGGGSLLFAAGFHVLVLVLGGLWIFDIIRIPEKKDVDFTLTGGKSGGGGSPQQATQKQQMRVMPVVNRSPVFAQGVKSNFKLPEPSEAFGDMGSTGSVAGGLGGGLGGTGLGGGLGNGTGKGFGDGRGGVGGLATAGPGLKLFGMDLNVKSIGVVLDVSGSMRKDLPRVLREIDRVAGGSPVILHVGCGLGNQREETGDEIKPIGTRDKGFERFWMSIYRDDSRDSVYRMLAKRNMTYYHEGGGTPLTGRAILSTELKDVEAIYWFADFQDSVDPEAAIALRDALIKNRQKLFIHAMDEGAFFETVNEVIAKPTGGGRIKAGRSDEP